MSDAHASPGDASAMPSDPQQIADMLAAALRVVVSILDAVEVPDDWAAEPSPPFRVIRRARG